jgi:hypothetical protein
MTLRELVSLLAAIVAIVFLVRSIFSKTDIRQKIIDLCLFLVCAATAIAIYFVSISLLPLKEEEKQAFRSSAFAEAALFRQNPLVRGLTKKADVEAIIRKIEATKSYEKEMPQETAIYYRLYAATILMSVDPSKPFSPQHVKDSFAYLRKSIKLAPNIWAKPHEKKAYKYIESLVKHMPGEVDLRELLTSVFGIVMISGEETDVQRFVEIVMGDIPIGKPKIDCEYFLAFQGKGGDYRTCILAFKTLIEGQGGKIVGPIFFPAEKGMTKVQYIILPKTKPRATVSWLVDKSQGIIEPLTPFAKELDDFVRNGKRN